MSMCRVGGCVGFGWVDVYLIIGVTDILAGVLVGQVQWVARELNTTALLALDEERVLVACCTNPYHQHSIPANSSLLRAKFLFLLLALAAFAPDRTYG